MSLIIFNTGAPPTEKQINQSCLKTSKSINTKGLNKLTPLVNMCAGNDL